MQDSRPNVLIVILDSARPAWLSCYNGATTTPYIDSIASDAYVFEEAIAPSAWTFPVMSSVFTSMMPAKHGGHDQHQVLDSQFPTMAEIFSRNGYDTAAIADVPYVGPMTRLDRGFRTMSNLGRAEVSIWNKFLKGIGRGHRIISRAYQKTNESRVVIGEAIRWLTWRRDRSKPFLLYMHSDEPHAPLLPPPRFRRRFTSLTARQMRGINQDKQLFVGGAVEMTPEDLAGLRDLALAETAYFDAWFGKLIDYLKREHLLDNTIVVVGADHGDNFGEHGLIRHGLCLYDTLLRVPLIIRPPGARGQTRVRQMVRLIDLLPTLLSMAAIDEPEAAEEFQGQDLVAAVSSGRFADFAIGELYRPTTGLFEAKVPDFMPEFRQRYDRVLRSYRTQNHKFIWSSNGRHELYDLKVDPAEECNLVASRPELVSEFQEKLDSWLASFQSSETETAAVEQEQRDEVVLKRLRDLGYVE